MKIDDTEFKCMMLTIVVIVNVIAAHVNDQLSAAVLSLSILLSCTCYLIFIYKNNVFGQNLENIEICVVRV